MSLIYPTNNSPNESPGRARNALGRSACALVVAGALVLPLTQRELSLILVLQPLYPPLR